MSVCVFITPNCHYQSSVLEVIQLTYITCRWIFRKLFQTIVNRSPV